MKKLIVWLLWIMVTILLGVFAYQKYTWKELTSGVVLSSYQSFRNYFKTIVCGTISKIQQKSCPQTKTTDLDSNIKIHISKDDPNRNLLTDQIRSDLDRNHQFSNNLMQIDHSPNMMIGKDGMIAIFENTQNHVSDKIIVINNSGDRASYPARYNFDNIYAYKTSNTNTIYHTNGLSFLDKNMVYYQATNAMWDTKIYFLNIHNGVTQVIDDAIPFLFFKGQYIFTTQPGNLYQDLYIYKDNRISKFGDQIISEINVDKDLISVYDPDDREIIFYSILDMKPMYIIKIDKKSISYDSFLEQWDTIWIRYKDNLTNKTIYERHDKFTIAIDDHHTDNILVSDISMD